MKRLDVVVLVGILATTGLILPAALQAQSEKSHRTKCANNLRQLALAAIQYADDKRFFPHVGDLRLLDGAVHSPDTPKTVRALVWYGYHDNPEGFICPASDDMNLEIRDRAVRENLRLWSWDRKRSESTTLSPFLQKGDPHLSKTTELSYGWTRKGMNANVRATSPLAADRAIRDGRDTSVLRGNHDDGWNVVTTDGVVTWHEHDAKTATGGSVGGRLVSMQQGGGYLSLRAQTKSGGMGRVTPRPKPTPWTGGFSGEGTELRIDARAWSERASSWSFKGHMLRKGGQKLPVWGRVDPDNKVLTGIVDGLKARQAISLNLEQDDGINLTIGETTTYLKRTSAATVIAPEVDERHEGVARALVSAVQTNNRAAAEALLTKESIAQLGKKGDWFEALQNSLQGKRVAAFIEHGPERVRPVDGTMKLDLVKRKRPERPKVGAVVVALRTVGAAQTLFRETDRENDGKLDYAANLKELIDSGLLGANAAKGTKDGYSIEVCHGSEEPEFTWMAVARPTFGSGPFFAINHEGAIYKSKTEFKLDTVECKIPGGVRVGR